MAGKHDNRPIGIFDSGLGGLTVTAALRQRLPAEDLIYLGDNARLPYGSKSKDTIIRFALEDAEFLIRREVKCVVVACNTVSSLAMPALQRRWPNVTFIGVVEAGVRKVLEHKRLRRVLLIGTSATVNSDSYRVQIQKIAPQVSVRSVACPLFVPLVEEGMTEGEVPERVARDYLECELGPILDAVILGCTHYPLMTKVIRKIVAEKTLIIDSSIACADMVEQHLIEHKMTADEPGRGTERFFVTDMSVSFFELAGRFLGRQIQHVDKVALPDDSGGQP